MRSLALALVAAVGPSSTAQADEDVAPVVSSFTAHANSDAAPIGYASSGCAGGDVTTVGSSSTGDVARLGLVVGKRHRRRQPVGSPSTNADVNDSPVICSSSARSNRVVASAATANADGDTPVALDSSAQVEGALGARAHPEPRRTLFYVEALGKAGAYGLGVERPITPRLSLGGAVSWISLRGQQIATVSPYLHATIFRRGEHALFGELGAVLVHSKIVSPVASWDGMSDTGGGGVAGLGWERDGKRFVFRAQGSVLVGEGGVGPWGGFAIGVKPGAFR
jgi:hypothetical protein